MQAASLVVKGLEGQLGSSGCIAFFFCQVRSCIYGFCVFFWIFSGLPGVSVEVRFHKKWCDNFYLG